MAKSRVNYLTVLGYVVQLLPLVSAIETDFSDDLTPADRKASTAHAVGSVVTAATQLITQNNPKYAADLSELNTVVQNAIAKYLSDSTDNSLGSVGVAAEANG